MRIPATVAAVSGALALSALAVPAAHAADVRPKAPSGVEGALAAAHAGTGRTTFTAGVDGEPYVLDAGFSNVKVNSGKNIAVGTTNVVTVPVSFKLTHAADVDIQASDFVAAIDLYRGSSFESSVWDFSSDAANCTASSSTVASCTSTVAIDPLFLLNEDAGAWKVAGFAVAFNGEDPADPNMDLSKVGVAVTDKVGAFNLQRYSKLTVNAAPEPVKKGKTVTVTGKLSRAGWDDSAYHGYATQSVKLQFRKKSATTYTTLKTVKTSSTGTLKTTTTATADGYFRYSFAGTTTTPALSAAGDYVDVQ